MGMTRSKGDPLEAGNPRRLTDARCAWRHMTPDQRVTFLLWIQQQMILDGEFES